MDIVRYVAVDDCGPAINPKLIDGQIHGGITHGIGQALYERIHYDDDGQLVTGTFVDYALPSAADVPSFETDRTETPSPVNSLGVKGVGEAGTIAASPGDRQLGDRRAAPARRGLHQHAAVAAARVVADRARAGPRRARGPGQAGRQLGRARERQRRLRTDQPERGRCAVIPAEFDYVRPGSLDEALAALRDGGEDAKILAGGHSLLPLMKLRLAAPTLLVDLGAVPGLSGIERANGGWRIGAMTPHVAMERESALGLASKVASTIADPQVRHRGTIGGSLAHGDPASDQLAILLAYEGSVVVRGESGEREIAAAELFQDYLTTAVGDDEVLTEVRLPAIDGYGFGYHKFNRRQEDWAMVAVGALVKKAAGRDLRGRARRAHAHELGAAAGDRGRAGAARAAARCRTRSPRPPSRPPRAPIPRRTSTPPPTTSAIWRAC